MEPFHLADGVCKPIIHSCGYKLRVPQQVRGICGTGDNEMGPKRFATKPVATRVCELLYKGNFSQNANKHSSLA